MECQFLAVVLYQRGNELIIEFWMLVGGTTFYILESIILWVFLGIIFAGNDFLSPKLHIWLIISCWNSHQGPPFEHLIEIGHDEISLGNCWDLPILAQFLERRKDTWVWVGDCWWFRNPANQLSFSVSPTMFCLFHTSRVVNAGFLLTMNSITYVVFCEGFVNKHRSTNCNGYIFA